MTGNRALSLQKQPNPQGKGVVPVLRDWSTMQTGALGPKSPEDFLRDYCISALILSATFRFKPVVDKPYFLYSRDQEFLLSLIAPHQWGQYTPGDFVGSCRLRNDMTWTMAASESEDSSGALATARRFIQKFIVSFSEQDSICENLPFYIAELPYYQRMLSTALASSLQRSLPNTGDHAKALLRAQPGLPLNTTYLVSSL